MEMKNASTTLGAATYQNSASVKDLSMTQTNRKKIRCRRCGEIVDPMKEAAETSTDGVIHAACMVEGEEIA